MRICISQLNPTIGAIQENVKKIIREIEKVKKAHEKNPVELIIFPEMAISGYSPDDLLLQSGFLEAVHKGLEEIIKSCSSIACIVGLPRRDLEHKDKPLCNSAAVIVNGKLVGYQDKALLPTYDVFDERRYFQPAISEKVWHIADARVGLTICEDIWAFSGAPRQERYAHDPLEVFEKKRIDLLINISASPYSIEKIELRNEVAKKASQKLSCPVILCNQVGAQDGIIYDGTSIVVSEKRGLLVKMASFQEESQIFDTKDLEPRTMVSVEPAAELFSALTLGVKDYFAKQGFTKALVGLSGGVDSALVAVIASVALGKKNVLGVLLPSRFTSSESTEDALYVASNLGINTVEIPIEKAYKTYLELLAPVFDDKPIDVTEENLQARIRATLLMAIANKEGYLLLNTSNKSELACGYSTLYGDAAGAIAVIGDLLKRQVYEVANWVMKTYGWITPRILEKAPSAELRLNHKDSDSLPEYGILDPIIEEYVVNLKSAESIAEKVGCPLTLVYEVISKIHQNEYKRRQCPFSLRVSEKAFSAGRRVPIVHRFLPTTS